MSKLRVFFLTLNMVLQKYFTKAGTEKLKGSKAI